MNARESDNPRAPKFTGCGQVGRKNVRAAIWADDDGRLSLSLASGDKSYRATLHPNERPLSEKSPDYYGLVSLGEERYKVAAWEGQNQFGEYISLAFTPFEPTEQRRVEAKPTARSGK